MRSRASEAYSGNVILEIVRCRRLKGKQYPEDAGGSETVLIALTVGRRVPAAAAVRLSSLFVAAG